MTPPLLTVRHLTGTDVTAITITTQPACAIGCTHCPQHGDCPIRLLHITTGRD